VKRIGQPQAIGARARSWTIVFLAAWIAAALDAPAQWTWPGYHSRLVLDIEDQNVPTAALAFCFGGHIRTDGKDVRIVSVTGLPVKSQVLYAHPTGLSQLAFAPILGMRRYYVYFGNPAETNPLPEPWEPTSGLLLETRAAPGKQYYADSLDIAKDLFQRADQVLGKLFVPTVFFGSSPFRAEGEIVSYLKGFLNVTDEGVYTFATSSLDSTFAVIDGKLVCQSPGAHDWTGGAHFKGEITLTKGQHVLEYHHVQRNAPMRCALVWKTPKGKGFEMIPATAFTRVAPVKIVGFEKAGLPFAADFDFTRVGDALKGDTQATIYQFKARSWGQEKPASFTWDFGDGTKGAGDVVEHAYFGWWEPTVQLTMTKGAATDRFTRSFRIHPAEGSMDEAQVLGRVAEIVKTYSANDIEPKSAAALIQFLKGARLNQVFAHVIEQQLNSPQGIPAEKLEEYLPLLADAYLDDSQFAKALQRYDEMIQKAGNSVAPEIKRAQLRAAQSCVHLRRFDEARQRHKALQQGVRADAILTPVERGFARDRIQAAIRQQRYPGARELLEEFVLKNPQVLEEDFPFMLRGRMAFGEKKWEAAATDFEFIEKIEPRSNFIPEALFLSGQSYAALGKNAEAAKAFERVVNRYGNSAFAERARQERAKLGS
jgi:TolA-binding protein